MKKNFLNQFSLSVLVVSFLIHARAAENSVMEMMQDSEPRLWDIIAEKDYAFSIDLDRWKNSDAKAGFRWQVMQQFYFANTKLKSNAGNKHVACFTGDGQKLVDEFFTKSGETKINSVQQVNVSISTDEKMIGVTLMLDPKSKGKVFANTNALHFRLTHCLDSGKNSMISNAKTLKIASLDKYKDRMPSEETPFAANDENSPDGFKMFDSLTAEEDIAAKDLPRFKIRHDYETAKPKDAERPWKNLDITTMDGKMQLARMALKHFYSGMIDVKKAPSHYFIAQENKKSYWCHMPWLNVGDPGREAIHGLTKERDLEPSAIYPNGVPGSDWGVGYYNSFGCKTLGKVFGSSKDKKARASDPKFNLGKFEQGTMSIKTLFTTSKTSDLDGAFTWTAHSTHTDQQKRELQEMRMLQIDVAIKDDTIKGSSAEADHWIMTTYYYDPTFTWDFANEFEGAPAGLFKMRPVGVHTGFDPSTSTIFPGSKTNSTANKHWSTDNLLVNGPADNPKGSCMGCHGVAGLKFPGMVPGIKDYESYGKFKDQAMDFSQQLAFAKKNFETRPIMNNSSTATGPAAEAVPANAAPDSKTQPPTEMKKPWTKKPWSKKDEK